MNIKKYIKILELDKILHKLANYTCCKEAYDRAIDLKPVFNYGYVQNEIGKASDALYLLSKYGSPNFMKLLNPVPHIKRVDSGGVLNFVELINMGNIIRTSRVLKEWHSDYCKLSTKLDEFFSNLTTNRDLEKKIFDSITSENEMSDFASDELYKIRMKILSSSSKVREKLDNFIKNSKYQKYLQENIITIRDGRFVIPVKAEYKGEFVGIVHDTSSSGATLFIEPIKIVEINNNIKILQKKELEEIEKILVNLSNMCGDFSSYILNNFELIVDLNLYFSKANLALEMDAFAPKLNNNGKITLNNARHPLIEREKVVPINIKLGDNYTCLIITGPNTGGKTVALKTLGLLSLMVMCGLMIPAREDSEIAIFNNILVDIGDEQSIENNLSTFSSHMTNIVSIIEQADDNTLILLDELGSGTDPVEGSALAISIVETLKNIGCTMLATTHYSELKIYALKTELVENASFEFDLKNLKPTYNMIVGIPGKSNAFEISKRLGLNNQVLDYAKNLLSEDTKKFEDVIKSLEVAKKNYESVYAEFIKKEEDLKLKLEDITSLKKEIQESKAKVLENANIKAQNIVENVKLNSDLILEEINRIKKESSNKSNISQNRMSLIKEIDKLHDMANPVIKKEVENYLLPRELKIGDNVLIYDIDKRATVISLPDKSGSFFVQVGLLKTKVNISNIRLLEEKAIVFKGSTTKTVDRSSRKATTEIDLRGYTVEEALMELDMFIDNCVLTNMNILTIIHGKGTGVLRREIHKYLKLHKNIKNYRVGIFGEGENGVTIAEIK